VTGTQQAARCATLKLLAAFELDRRLKGSGVDVVACHPGIAATEVRCHSLYPLRSLANDSSTGTL